MAEWIVELRGHVFDLEALADLFPAPDCHVFAEGGDYRLKSTLFNALADDAEVYAKAKCLMPTINGLASVFHPGYRNVTLSGGIASVDADGTRKRFIHESLTETIRFKDSAEAAGGATVGKCSNPAADAVKVAFNEEIVNRALQFFCQAKSWVNLYKVLDAIRDDLGSLDALNKKNWVAAAEISRFTGTANNHTAAEGEARHGLDYGRPMANPMTLIEAETLMRTLLQKWLTSKTSG
jgi:hypothetical protein